MGAPGAIRVVHRHRIGRHVFARVSELTYLGNRPMAVLSWLHHGEKITPGVCVELDPVKLRQGATRRLYRYEGITDDPRWSRGS